MRTTPTRFRRLAVLALAGVLAGSTLTSSVAAQTRVFHDADDQADGTVLDVTRVKVTYGKRAVARLRHHGTPLTVSTRIHFYYDTDPDDPGPEFRSRLVPNSDAFALYRVDRWRGVVERRSCASLSGAADIFSNGPLVMRVGARCLGRPDRVRVAVRVKEPTDDGAFVEWAPARRTTFGAVRRH